MPRKKEIPLRHGFPISTKFIGSQKMLNVRMTSVAGHATMLGATRSGKSARFVNPLIQISPYMEVKPSLIISDPKGELFETHSQHLKEEGYEVLPINLRDEKKSINWNPLSSIWDLWFKYDPSKDIMSAEASRDEAKERLSALSLTIFPDNGAKDKLWTQGASTIFQFMVLSMLEIAPYNSEITKDKFNIANVTTNLNSSTYRELVITATFLQDKANKEKRISPALVVGGRNIRGAEQTVGGMVQNAVTLLTVYTNGIIKKITSSTSFKIDDSKPQAFFLVVPDENKSMNGFISLFVSETYKELISIAMKNNDSKLKRPLYYLLDEFGNIPKIPNLDSMVTVSASRQIYFLFVLQSYKQIEKIYGKEDASVILGNCAYEFYLLTNEFETAEAFSKKLGEKEVLMTSTSTSSNERGTNTSRSTSSRTRRLLDPNELMKLKEGEMIIRLQRDNPIRTTLAPFWEYPSFRRGEVKLEFSKAQGSFDKQFTYNYIQWIIDTYYKEKEEKKQNGKSKVKTKSSSEKKQNDHSPEKEIISSEEEEQSTSSKRKPLLF